MLIKRPHRPWHPRTPLSRSSFSFALACLVLSTVLGSAPSLAAVDPSASQTADDRPAGAHPVVSPAVVFGNYRNRGPVPFEVFYAVYNEGTDDYTVNLLFEIIETNYHVLVPPSVVRGPIPAEGGSRIYHFIAPLRPDAPATLTIRLGDAAGLGRAYTTTVPVEDASPCADGARLVWTRSAQDVHRSWGKPWLVYGLCNESTAVEHTTQPFALTITDERTNATLMPETGLVPIVDRQALGAYDAYGGTLPSRAGANRVAVFLAPPGLGTIPSEDLYPFFRVMTDRGVEELHGEPITLEATE